MKHYNYFRDYDPGIGRYVQSDPIGLRGGADTFGYARAAPHGLIDPLGLFVVDKECCGKDASLNQQVSNACKLVANRITDPKLKECILTRCESARVTCDGLMCRLTNSVSNVVGWQSALTGGTITLCMKANDDLSAVGHWGCVAIHEWAHSCGWGHGGGAGVPGSTGAYSFDECKSWKNLPPRSGPPTPKGR